MKNNLSAKLNEITTLEGKDDFTVQDLIDVLTNIDSTAKVSFATMGKRYIDDNQKENLIFRLHQDDRDDEICGNYRLVIITKIVEI